MKLKLFLAAGIATLASSAAMADGAALYAEKTCIACHGKEGKKPMIPAFPKIAGQNAAYIELQMRDIKSGARANGSSAAMKGVMVNPEGVELVTDKDIKDLALYLSKLK
ncbi:MAG: c-type cytochrome [Burkholderiales bacterium]